MDIDLYGDKGEGTKGHLGICVPSNDHLSSEYLPLPRN